MERLPGVMTDNAHVDFIHRSVLANAIDALGAGPQSAKANLPRRLVIAPISDTENADGGY